MPNGRASPGVGRAAIGDNSGLPTHEDVRSALALQMILDEEQRKLNEKKKRVRKRIEGMRIPLAELDFLKKQQDRSASEIEQEFRIRWQMVGAIFDKLFEQFDLFAPKASAPETRAAYYTMGLMKGLKGEEASIPPAIVGDDRNQYLEGFNEGASRRKTAQESILMDALDPEKDGQVVDGTRSAVNNKAHADFVADTGGDPLVVAGVTYPTMRQANAARKRQEAEAAGAKPLPEPSNDEPASTSHPAYEMAEAIRIQQELQAQDTEVTHVAEEFGEAAAAALAGGAIVLDPDLVNRNDNIPVGTVVGEIITPPLADGAAAPLKVEEFGQAKVRETVSLPKSFIPTPDFDDWSNDPDEWTAVQTAEFTRWAESKPAEHVPAISHQGAVTMWRRLREPAPAVADPEDSFGASAAELEQQVGRRQSAEVPEPPSEEHVAAVAAKLGAKPRAKRSGPLNTRASKG